MIKQTCLLDESDLKEIKEIGAKDKRSVSFLIRESMGIYLLLRKKGCFKSGHFEMNIIETESEILGIL